MGTAQLPHHPDSYRVFSRRGVMLWFLAALLVGGLAGWLIQDYLGAYLRELEQMAREDPETAARRALPVLKTILGAMACLMVITGFYLSRYGHRALRARRFPPPGAWVIEGRHGYEGQRAAWAGWGHIVLGGTLVLSGLAAMFYTWVTLPQILLIGAAPAP